MSHGARAFSPDYTTARTRFREAAARAGFDLLAYPIDQLGPHGVELTIDVARKGPSNPQRTLVVSSGTHGVEGFFGSAVQLSLLDGSFPARQLPEHTSVVLIHAINPYGFAHSRRVNEDNIDQNRNFLLDGQAFTGAPDGYQALDPLLNPKSAPSRRELFALKAGREVLRRGFRSLKSAVAQGQYDFPQGLFFGGHGPSKSQRILAEHARDFIGRPERVIHTDFHTGLGKWGSYALCVDLPASNPRVAQLGREFGVVQGFDTKGVLYEIKGGLGSWLAQRFASTQYDCLLAEFGTYHTLRVLSAMRQENRAHHYAQGDQARLGRAKSELREVFSPASPAWRTEVVHKGIDIVEQALAALGSRR